MATLPNEAEVSRVGTPNRSALEMLARDGIITLDAAPPRTTKRWQTAMMRAIARNMRAGGDEVDLRYIVADALLEIYGPAVSEAVLADAVEAMTLVELELLRAPKSAASAGR